MFERIFLKEALKNTWALEIDPGSIAHKPSDSQGSVTSLLIYNIFGGEILKTPEKKNRHFYNRINGERLDFTRSDLNKSYEDYQFEDLPFTPGETHNYFVEEDYSSFSIKFIGAYEEAVGLCK
jgi:hypothetical protein